jgi:hypothetical protein
LFQRYFGVGSPVPEQSNLCPALFLIIEYVVTLAFFMQGGADSVHETISNNPYAARHIYEFMKQTIKFPTPCFKSLLGNHEIT